MSRKPKRPSKRIRPEPDSWRAPTDENQSADAVTVAWMLAAMATAGADLGAALLWLLAWFWPGPAGAAAAGSMFLPTLLLFIAAVTGTACLLLIPVVYRVRRVPPPGAITAFAVAVSAIPLGTFVALLLK